MAINPQDPENGDFDDEIFDGEEEFLAEAFDEEAFDESEYAQEGGTEEGDFAGEDDFSDDEWPDDEQAPVQDQKPYKERKGGLSFNTIVIIGAVVVGGGVMAMTVMNKSAQVAAESGNVFQSFLNMTGVMDGMLFGEKNDAPSTPVENTPSEEGGFLNDPGTLAQANDTNPPQPVPMAPPENAVPEMDQPLTPLPEDLQADIPRGPEDNIPTGVADTGTKNAAQDILEQAIANRAKEREPQEQKPAAEPITPEPPIAETAEQKPIIESAPSPVVAQQQPPVAAISPVQEKALEENTKALQSLSSTMEKMASRMERMEGDLGSVRDAQQESYSKLEKTVESLQQDVAALKNRPAPSVVQKIESTPPEKKAPVVEEKKPAPVSKKAEPKKNIKPAENVAKAAGAAGPWELRAAQPGRAWLSKPGSKEMQSVQVGQTLPGLGRVTGITYQYGRWSVVGTQGTIQQ